MKKIVVFDPTVVTDNLGDFIILDSIRSHLHSLFPDDFFILFQRMNVLALFPVASLRTLLTSL